MIDLRPSSEQGLGQNPSPGLPGEADQALTWHGVSVCRHVHQPIRERVRAPASKMSASRTYTRFVSTQSLVRNAGFSTTYRETCCWHPSAMITCFVTWATNCLVKAGQKPLARSVIL
jgi:hypothetical protein